MSIHPENDPKINELQQYMSKQETVAVWCKGCEDWRPINAAYAKYCQGEIDSCSLCRK